MEALARGGGPDVRARFFRSLLCSRLLVPSPGLKPGLDPRACTGRETDVATNADFVESSAPDGSRGMVVFTDEQALLVWRPTGCPFTTLPASDVFGMALAAQLASLVFNPANPIAGYVSRYELLALAEGRVPPPLGKNEAMQASGLQLRRLDHEIPTALKELISAVGPTLIEVRAVWLLALTIERGESHLCVVIDHRPGANPDTFVPPLMTQIQTLLRPGEYVDCIPMPSGSELLQQAWDASVPIFAAKKSRES